METGREWDHTATSQDHPEPLLDEAGRDPSTPTQEPLEGTWPCDTRISEFRPPDREHIPIVFSSQARGPRKQISSPVPGTMKQTRFRLCGR